MIRVYVNGEFEEWSQSDPRIIAYDALNIAAHKIGIAGYNTSIEIKDLQKAMADVLSDAITPEEAMSLLHYGNTGYLLDKVRK